ncbi:hypothetical protein BH24CHL5_BH24CHL5_00420 [soil metagenome]
MTYRTDTDVETVAHDDGHAHAPDESHAGHSHSTEVRSVSYQPNPLATVERVIVFLFSLMQLLIGLRIVLLLVAARQGNDIVAAIYNVSEVFVAPFRGILRIDEVQAGATALDVGAIVALIGWVIIEVVVIALLRMFRPARAV